MSYKNTTTRAHISQNGSQLLYKVSGYVWIVKENVLAIHKTNYQMQAYA